MFGGFGTTMVNNVIFIGALRFVEWSEEVAAHFEKIAQICYYFQCCEHLCAYVWFGEWHMKAANPFITLTGNFQRK